MASAYVPYQECMESVTKETRSSTEDFCSYSSSEVYGISKEINKELHRGLLLIVEKKKQTHEETKVWASLEARR